MTRAEVAALLASARAEAARRCGLDTYPAEIVAVSERLARASWRRPGERAALKRRLDELQREMTR